MPNIVSFLILNSPARILIMNVKILKGEKELYSYPLKNLVRYPPDSRVEWPYEIPMENFIEILKLPDVEKQKLRRIISVEYTSLNGGKKYHFYLEQSFGIRQNQWNNMNETAD